VNRQVTLFTGQWADIPRSELFPLVKKMGYDGVELACWGDHFNVKQACEEDGYVEKLWDDLSAHDLTCYAISNHLVGQAICDPVDERHKAIVPEDVWGDGDPEGVRQRAAENMKNAARSCRKFFEASNAHKTEHHKKYDRLVVNGFTGSSIWHAWYAFPPTDQAYIEKGFEDFAKRWLPIFEVFDGEGVDFALEVHPTEIGFDTVSTQRAIEAVGGHKRFGVNFDPSHLGYQGVDYIAFLRTFADRVYHVHMKDAWWGHGDGSVGVMGGHTDFGDPRRYWDFRSVGRGDIVFEDIIATLNDINYNGPLSVEWEDGRMDRIHGATESCGYVRSIDFPPNATKAFDAAFSNDSN
jgi:sugar phosphate isomerase/epimerase